MGLRKKSREEAEDVEGPSEEALAEDEQVSDADIRPDLVRLASEKLSFKMGVRKELKNLPGLLSEGEGVLNLASGQYGGRQGLLVVTDRRLLFYEKGMGRSRQEDFPYSKISSIQTSTGMMSGELIIFASGNKAKVEKVLPKERTTEIGDYIRNRISDDKPVTTPTAAAAPSAADRLQTLQSMRDQGLVSDDEFEAKRQQILADL